MAAITTELFDASGRPIQVVLPRSESGRSTGTTTASYVAALTWDCSHLRGKSIHLVNTHATLTLYYKLLATYNTAQTAGKEDELVAQTSLGVGTDARMTYNNEYSQLVLQVVDNSGHATYEVNWIGKEG